MMLKQRPLLLTLLAVAIIAAVAFFFVSRSGNSITELEDVVRYIEPEAYYVTGAHYKLATTPAGQGKVILPRELDVGEFGKEPEFQREVGFVGPDVCKECHEENYSTFIETAHYRTSALPNDRTMKGSLSDSSELIQTRVNPLRYEVSEKDGDYYQSVLLDRDGKTWNHQQHVDIVTGSGKNGQSYLFWQKDRLYQLPISWLKGVGWVNSPGYTDGLANFARPVRDDCMACHSTKMDFARRKLNLADRHTMILGVTCERCHGPGQKHVEFHRANPDAASKHIVHPGLLPRERMNDVCSQCHSGSSKLLQPAYSFRPGEDLSKYRKFTTNGEKAGGVHTANQFPRLRKSKCYQSSDTMSCATCHNPHRNERDRPDIFSNRCQKCHQPEACGQFSTLGQKIATNCIDCHMPKKMNKSITFDSDDADAFNQVRDHFIRIEPAATAEVIQRWKTEKQTK